MTEALYFPQTSVLKGGFLVHCSLEDQPSSTQTKAPCVGCYHVPIFHYHFRTLFSHSSEAVKLGSWHRAPSDCNPIRTYSLRSRQAYLREGLRVNSQTAAETEEVREGISIVVYLRKKNISRSTQSQKPMLPLASQICLHLQPILCYC